MKAREVMVKAPVTLPTSATIHEAATAMDRACVGAVVVLDGERPVGLVTDRDLVTRALARRMPLDARVDAVMSTGVVCVDADAELSEVASILAPTPSVGCRWSSRTAWSGWSRSTTWSCGWPTTCTA